MSYRAFKHLLGETSLERKCRFLFSAGSFLLITASFLLYALKTESLAYEQVNITGRLLVNPIIERIHLKRLNVTEWNWEPPGDGRRTNSKVENLGPEKWAQLRDTFEELSKDQLPAWTDLADPDPDKQARWQYSLLKARGENRPEDSFETELLQEFIDDPTKNEDRRELKKQPVIRYYGAIRATNTCLNCHGNGKDNFGELQQGDLMAVAKIRLSTGFIDYRIHWNRAILMATALGTALLIMSGSYLIVRYVIVKPVRHLKEVSDAISAGKLNVRSEIQTGDEFEDLSHAFNRMLRNLVSMQDQWKKVNVDLDRKVDELAQANLALYESNRLKSDFMATMSHELRTPLNSILGFSDVLGSSNLNEKQQRWVGNIKSSGERLLNLINDILDLAKIEAGKMQVRLEEFSILDVAEGLTNMFKPLAEKKNIDLRTQIDPAVPLLRQDVVKLQQILSNLLSNAIKFTPEGGRVILKAESEMQQLVLTVTDTGVGIAPEDQELVFEKFRQSGNPLTREHAGTGLGLSIVRELSKLLGGEVSLQSELGRGSTFTVRLPLQLSQEPRLEFDLADERVDLSKAQRVDVRLYSASRDPGPMPQAPGEGI
jgi:signal transduction histidine kinase